jgi:hypothetical protein
VCITEEAPEQQSLSQLMLYREEQSPHPLPQKLHDAQQNLQN